MNPTPWTDLFEAEAPAISVAGRRATLDDVSWASLVSQTDLGDTW